MHRHPVSSRWRPERKRQHLQFLFPFPLLKRLPLTEALEEGFLTAVLQMTSSWLQKLSSLWINPQLWRSLFLDDDIRWEAPRTDTSEFPRGSDTADCQEIVSSTLICSTASWKQSDDSNSDRSLVRLDCGESPGGWDDTSESLWPWTLSLSWWFLKTPWLVSPRVNGGLQDSFLEWTAIIHASCFSFCWIWKPFHRGSPA